MGLVSPGEHTLLQLEVLSDGCPKALGDERVTTIHVTQEKLEAVFTLDFPIYGDRYDAYKDALDGARVGTRSAFAPITKALLKRRKAA